MDQQKQLQYFSFTDPRDGDIGVKYTAKTQAEMEAKADALGQSRFQGVTADDEPIQFVKHEGQWRLEADILAAQRAETSATKLANQIRGAYMDKAPTPAEYGPELRQAFEEMGVNPHKDAERRALGGIIGRSLEYAEATAEAQRAMRNGEVLPPNVAQQWAELDAREFRKIQERQRQENVAAAMVASAAANAEYKAALSEKAPDVAAQVAALEAEREGRNGPTRARDMAEAREVLGFNAIEPHVEREQQRLAPDEEAKQAAWLKKGSDHQADQTKAAERPAKDNEVQSDEVFTASKADIKPVVPPEVEQQYLHVGNKFYHPKNTQLVAFEDKGNKLETKSNSEHIAESMVRIAEARGWDEIKVTGSETFRREVWLEAASRGMHVKGYVPSEQDKAELAKRTRETEAHKVENDGKPFRARENESEEGKGRAAPEPPGLERQRAQAFAKEEAPEVVKKRPELAGAYAAVAAIERKTEADGLTPQQHAVVMARVRQNVVNSIERGEIPEVKVKDEIEIKRERQEEREVSR